MKLMVVSMENVLIKQGSQLYAWLGLGKVDNAAFGSFTFIYCHHHIGSIYCIKTAIKRTSFLLQTCPTFWLLFVPLHLNFHCLSSEKRFPWTWESMIV